MYRFIFSKITFRTVCLSAALCLAWCIAFSKFYLLSPSCASSPSQTIGIIQIIDHPALNETRKGIIETLEKKRPGIKIIWESAQGNPALATQICQNFVGKSVDAIVALGTIPAQAAVAVTKGKNIPVIFASVTDPETSKLTTRSTGVSNYIDVERQLDAICQVMPNLKRLGTLYNPGESFAERVLCLLKEACAKRGITVVANTVSKTSDVMGAAQSIADQVDGIFINNDNTVLSAFPALVQVCDSQKIPAFSSDTESVKQGALLVLGPDQYKLGEQTACMIDTILTNFTPVNKMPIEYPKETSVEFHINMDKVAQFNIPLDPSLKEKAIPFSKPPSIINTNEKPGFNNREKGAAYKCT